MHSLLRQSQLQFHFHILNYLILQLQSFSKNRNMLQKNNYLRLEKAKSVPLIIKESTWFGGVHLTGCGVWPAPNWRSLTDKGLCFQTFEGVSGGWITPGVQGEEVQGWLRLDLTGRYDLGLGVKKRSALLNVDIVIKIDGENEVYEKSDFGLEWWSCRQAHEPRDKFQYRRLCRHLVFIFPGYQSKITSVSCQYPIFPSTSSHDSSLSSV